MFSHWVCLSNSSMAEERTSDFATPVGGRTVPDFGKMYHVKGELSLPYSEIKEPFEAWYDLEGNRSRIDYQNGTVRTFLIGNDLDYGAIYTITPVTNETEIQAIKFFQLKGTKEDPIRPQSAMPDLQGFEFEKMEDHAGFLCEVWKNVTQVGHKKNTYRLWVTRPEGNDSPATPHHFEMVGFNTLLESHNDKYTIDYSDFSPQTESDIFIPPGGMTCDEFPDPVEEHQILANPIQDYVNTSPVSHAHHLFGPFKEKFERQYESEKEHEERENYFIHTLRSVHSTNRAGLTYSVRINDFADWSKEELARMTGGSDCPPTGELHIWLREIVGLLPTKRGAPSTYVKSVVLSDESGVSGQQTRVVRGSVNPVFNHTMVYDGFQSSDLIQACAEITVWNPHPSGCLGGVRLSTGSGVSYGQAVCWMDSTEDEISVWSSVIQSPNSWVDTSLPIRTNLQLCSE